jgi:integrase
MNLNSRTVAALTLPVGKGDVIYFDDELKGFGYRLRRSHADPTVINKSWVAQYRHHGRSRRVLVGNAAVPAAEARAKAKKILAAASLGDDPQGERVDRRGRDLHTFRNVVADFLAAKEPTIRTKTFYDLKRYLTAAGYFGPIHSIPIDTVARRDIARCLAKIQQNAGATTAVRSKAAVSALYTWCLRMGLVEANPVIGAGDVANPKPRSRVLSDAELAAVWRAAGDDELGRIVRLLVLTGCRRQEIGGMRWSELDREAGTWTLPAERAKNERSLTLPLAPAVWEIVDKVPHMAGRDHLFGTRSPDGYVAWHAGKTALDARVGDAVAVKWNLHDLRRSTATGMANIGIQPHLIETILNHASGHKAGVAGVYNRSVYENEVRAALARWADHVIALAEGGERKIVAFPAAAS